MDGNWDNFAPMIVSWIFLVALFVLTVELIATSVRKVNDE